MAKKISPAAERAYRLWSAAKEKNPSETTASICKRLKLTSSTLHIGRKYYENNKVKKSNPKILPVPQSLGLQTTLNVISGPQDQSMLIIGNSLAVAEIASSILKSWTNV